MTKNDLIETVRQNNKLSRAAAETVVKVFFDAMADALAAGERVEIRGLCSFCVKDYDGYTGRNPKTGKKVQVQPKRLPYFKVGLDLKKRLSK